MGPGTVKTTALSVCRRPFVLGLPGLEHRCLSGREFKSAADVQAAWLDAIDLVETETFFFIDDDDALPDDYLSVLEECAERGAAVAYTDEDVGGTRRARGEYSQARHLADPLLLHHLVLCRTEVARKVASALPRGHFWPELMLYWAMARRGGAAYVPRVGYHWRPRPGGLHRAWFTVLGIHRSRAWCAQNRGTSETL